MKSLLARATIALSWLMPLLAAAQVASPIDIAPPALPVYAQPVVPGEGYIWMPGYWAWEEVDATYYWVPGTWVLAPNDGDLWTPGYWAFEGSGYLWHTGYWGSRVGFYGGINYGFGYFGSGYQGGRWDHGAFRYNRAVSNVDMRIVHRVYSAPAVNNRGSNRVSFNGGDAGAAARPTAAERQFQFAEHAGPTADQTQHENNARAMPTQRATGPHGVAQVAGTPRPSEFAAPSAEHVRTDPVMRPMRAGAIQGAATSAHAPETEPQRIERQGAVQTRSEEPRGAHVGLSRPEQRGPAVHPESQQEGQPRSER